MCVSRVHVPEHVCDAEPLQVLPHSHALTACALAACALAACALAACALTACALADLVQRSFAGPTTWPCEPVTYEGGP